MKHLISFLLGLVLLLSAVTGFAEDVPLFETPAPEASDTETQEPDATATGTAAPAATPQAGAAGETGAETAEALFARLYTEHQALHEMDSLADSEAEPPLQCFFPTEAPESIMNCFDLLIEEKREAPKDMNAVYDLFLEVFLTAETISRGETGAAIVNLEKYDDQYQKKVQQVMPGDKWWVTFTSDKYDALIVPFYFADEGDAVIDDSVYFLSVLAMEDKMQVWICADQELVRQMMQVMLPADAGASDDPVDTYLNAWVAGEQGADADADGTDAAASPSSAPTDEETATAQPTIDPSTVTMPPTIGTPGDAGAGSAQPQDAQSTGGGGGMTFAQPDTQPAASGTDGAGAADPANAQSSTGDRIGVVTVTAKNTINLRAEPNAESKRVAESSNGRKYDCLEISPEGWYKIRLKNGTVAYVAPTLVEYESDTPESGAGE